VFWEWEIGEVGYRSTGGKLFYGQGWARQRATSVTSVLVMACAVVGQKLLRSCGIVRDLDPACDVGASRHSVDAFWSRTIDLHMTPTLTILFPSFLYCPLLHNNSSKIGHPCAIIGGGSGDPRRPLEVLTQSGLSLRSSCAHVTRHLQTASMDYMLSWSRPFAVYRYLYYMYSCTV
jgi:hypothetical protein